MPCGSVFFACPEPFDRLRTGLSKGGSWFEADTSAQAHHERLGAHHERLGAHHERWRLDEHG
ncbi:MAG: hypothetical protein WBC82_01920 [Dehalococcoidia bacterium]